MDLDERGMGHRGRSPPIQVMTTDREEVRNGLGCNTRTTPIQPHRILDRPSSSGGKYTALGEDALAREILRHIVYAYGGSCGWTKWTRCRLHPWLDGKSSKQGDGLGLTYLAYHVIKNIDIRTRDLERLATCRNDKMTKVRASVVSHRVSAHDA